jgi:hypothetical protein
MFRIYATCCHIHEWVAVCDNFLGRLGHIGMGGIEQDILSATYVLFLQHDVLCPKHGERLLQTRFSCYLLTLRPCGPAKYSCMAAICFQGHESACKSVSGGTDSDVPPDEKRLDPNAHGVFATAGQCRC